MATDATGTSAEGWDVRLGLLPIHDLKAWLDARPSGQHPGTTTIAMPRDWAIVEASWSPLDRATDYLNGHIPGAINLDTDQLETGYPRWQLKPMEELQAWIGSQGIRPETTVIVYSRQLIAAARVWWILKYIGVRDVRILDGDDRTWSTEGWPLETQVSQRPPVTFSAPGLADWLIDTPTLESVLARQTGDSSNVAWQLWDVRGQAEFAGEISGYSYLEARGRIPAARWLGDADDASGIYKQANGRLTPPIEILEHWKKRGFLNEEARGRTGVIFYCGGGWRSSLAFYYAWLLRMEPIRNYSDGWAGWSTRYISPESDTSDESWGQVPTGRPFEVGASEAITIDAKPGQ